MPDIIRDGALGQLVRIVTKNKVFSYPEERPDFSVPDHYRGSSASSTYDRTTSTPATLVGGTNPTTSYLSIAEKEELSANVPPTLDVDQTLNRVSSKLDEVANPEMQAVSQAKTQRDIEASPNDDMQPQGSKLIRPETLKDGTVLVTWYTEDDSANPQNWSTGKKVSVTGESQCA
jgi:DHA1 family multidrug resistance protein-like MFS transporter